ncbi:MAG TPA: hypothetical protein VF820_01240 [Patescibacteria group bacterium]
MKNLIEWLRSPKNIGLLFFAFLVLVGLPVTVLLVQQQQVTTQKAAGQIWIYYDSNHQIYVTYNGDNYDSSTGTYTAKFNLKNVSSQSITIQPIWLENFCPEGNKSPCLENQNVINTSPVTLGPGQDTGNNPVSYSTSSTKYLNYTPATPACGTFQYDFFFSTSTGGFYGTSDLHTTWAASWYDTNNTCTQKPPPSNTPVPPTNTPIPPTATPVPPSDTPTDTPSPTVPITPSVTPTSTPGPSATPTLTPSPTLTPTPGPSGVQQPPVCTSLTADRGLTGPAPYALTFTGSGKDADGTIQKAIFTFSDEATPETVTTGGGIGTSTVAVQLAHSFQNPGTYTATVAFVDNTNLQSSANTSCQLSMTITTPPTGHYTSPYPTTPPLARANPSPIPPTGNSFVNIGIIGAVVAVLGGLLLVGAL